MCVWEKDVFSTQGFNSHSPDISVLLRSATPWLPWVHVTCPFRDQCVMSPNISVSLSFLLCVLWFLLTGGFCVTVLSWSIRQLYTTLQFNTYTVLKKQKSLLHSGRAGFSPAQPEHGRRSRNNQQTQTNRNPVSMAVTCHAHLWLFPVPGSFFQSSFPNLMSPERPPRSLSSYSTAKARPWAQSGIRPQWLRPGLRPLRRRSIQPWPHREVTGEVYNYQCWVSTSEVLLWLVWDRPQWRVFKVSWVTIMCS